MAFTFTDPTITTSTLIRAVHINELRAAGETCSSTAGYSAPIWADGSRVAPGVHPNRFGHINELRILAETWLPGHVWNQQVGVTAAAGRLNTSIPMRTVHIQELRDAYNQILDMLTAFRFTSATLEAIEGTTAVGNHPRITINLAVPYSENPSLPAEIMLTSSNTSVCTTLSSGFSVDIGDTQIVIDLPSFPFLDSGFVYYTVNVPGQPDIGSVVTNEVEVIYTALEVTSFSILNQAPLVGQTVGCQVGFNRQIIMGDSFWLTTDQPMASSIFTEIRNSPQIGIGILIINVSGGIGSNTFSFDLTAGYTGPDEYLSAHCSPTNTVTDGPVVISSVFRIINLSTVDATDGNTYLEIGHQARTTVTFNRANVGGDPSSMTFTYADGTVGTIPIDVGDATKIVTHSNFPR